MNAFTNKCIDAETGDLDVRTTYDTSSVEKAIPTQPAPGECCRKYNRFHADRLSLKAAIGLGKLPVKMLFDWKLGRSFNRYYESVGTPTKKGNTSIVIRLRGQLPLSPDKLDILAYPRANVGITKFNFSW